ncbi:MAG TPA: TetR/AcrR family transcriptional regulator [Terriglobales bacterium]|nr:TetR/AcrR family transcriptional regulator [Terriglobales bacterium]
MATLVTSRMPGRAPARTASRLNSRLGPEDRREQILDSAIPLFARHGFNGTTTRRIAEKAGVNEAIIFRHFPTKQDLYWAIIERKCRTAGRRQMIQEKLCSGASETEIFTAIARAMLERTRKDQDVTRLLLFSSLERHELSERFFRTYVSEVYYALGEYIQERIEAGAFRPVDPVLGARMFLGMVVYHNWVQELFGGGKLRRYDADLVARTVAETWLRGVQVREAGAQNGSAPGDPRSRRAVARVNGAAHRSQTRNGDR